jgi:hypothetical protein
MSQRYARVPFLLCKFHAHACNPGRLCQRYAPVLYLLCIFHTWLRQQAEGSCLLRAWSGCSVITGFLQQPTSSGAIQATLLQGVQAQALHKSCLTSTHACCTLCCCKLVLAVAWVQGSRSSTAAHTECGAILIQQYQGVQAHCACSMCAKVMLYLHARLQQAAASLCSLVCDCYRVLTTAHRVVRAADQNPCT